MNIMLKIVKSAVLSFLIFLSIPAFAGTVNINTADAETLTSELTGIGEKKAMAIIEYRTQNGPFKSAEDLALVKGIGDNTIEKNRENIVIE